MGVMLGIEVAWRIWSADALAFVVPRAPQFVVFGVAFVALVTAYHYFQRELHRWWDESER